MDVNNILSFPARITSLVSTLQYGLHDNRKHIQWNQRNTHSRIQVNWIGDMNVDVNYAKSKSDIVEHLIAVLSHSNIDVMR